MRIKNEASANSCHQKLLGILFYNKFDFDDVTLLCSKASQKLNTLARIAHDMNLAQGRLVMDLFAVWILSAGMDFSHEETKESYKQYS